MAMITQMNWVRPCDRTFPIYPFLNVESACLRTHLGQGHRCQRTSDHIWDKPSYRYKQNRSIDLHKRVNDIQSNVYQHTLHISYNNTGP